MTRVPSLAEFSGQEVDAGTSAEVGYAAALGLPCLAIRSDPRAGGEPGMRVNLQLAVRALAEIG